MPGGFGVMVRYTGLGSGFFGGFWGFFEVFAKTLKNPNFEESLGPVGVLGWGFGLGVFGVFMAGFWSGSSEVFGPFRADLPRPF